MCPLVHKIHNGHAFMISKTNVYIYLCTVYALLYVNYNDGIIPFTKKVVCRFQKIKT